MVGQVAAEIRSLRPPEPYKGKGIKYAGEHSPQGRQGGRQVMHEPIAIPKTRAREARIAAICACARRSQGTAERPRLVVFRSLKHIYAQLVDDARPHAR